MGHTASDWDGYDVETMYAAVSADDHIARDDARCRHAPEKMVTPDTIVRSEIEGLEWAKASTSAQCTLTTISLRSK